MKNLLLILGIAAVCSCSSMSVKNSYETGKNLTSYQTYNYHKFKYTHYDSIPYNENIYTYFIEQMDKSMTAKELSLSDDPHLILNIGVVVRQEQQTRETDIRTDMNYAGQRNYHWEVEDQVVGVYDVGDITIDFVDAKEKMLVWQVSVEGMLSKKEKKMKDRIDYAVEKMFEGFPAK